MTSSSPKYQEALKILPVDLVPIFDELLEHYKYAALKCHGRQMASPLVIAELVLLGWRNVEDERQPLVAGHQTNESKSTSK